MKNIFLNKLKYIIRMKIDMNYLFISIFYQIIKYKEKTAYKSCLVLDCKYITF